MAEMLDMPEYPEAERNLISTLAALGSLDPGNADADCQRAVLASKPEHFVHPQYRAIFAAIQGLYADCCEITPDAIMVKLEKANQVHIVGGYQGIVTHISGSEVALPTVLSGMIQDAWIARQAMVLGSEVIKRSGSRLEPIADVLHDVSGKLLALGTNGVAPRVVASSRLLDKIHAGEAFREGTTNHKLAWFGIPRWDDAVECSPGHVVIIAARPGQGKTGLAIQGAVSTSNRGQKTMIVSLEMDENEIDSRIASHITGESARNFRIGKWSAASAQTLMNNQPVLDRILTWCMPSNRPMAEVESAIRDAVRMHGIGSVWIDYFTLIQKLDRKGANDASIWGAISTNIKRLAQELKICIVLLSQLNREGDAIEPKLSDLRETGQLEQDANAVVMLWPKDAKAADTQVDSKDVFGKLAKNRSGASGWKCELQFMGAISKFSEITKTTDQKPSSRSIF